MNYDSSVSTVMGCGLVS